MDPSQLVPQAPGAQPMAPPPPPIQQQVAPVQQQPAQQAPQQAPQQALQQIPPVATPIATQPIVVQQAPQAQPEVTFFQRRSVWFVIGGIVATGLTLLGVKVFGKKSGADMVEVDVTPTNHKK